MRLKKTHRFLGILVLFAALGGLLVTFVSAQSARSGQDMAAAQHSLPAPGIYQIDGDHSFAFFGARHHVVGLVRGRFDKVSGTVSVSRDLADCSIDVTIDVASISTQIKERDEDLQSPAYFDVKKFPVMTYRGRGIRHLKGNLWIMDGALTIRGVTKIVPLTFAFNGMDLSVKSGNPARAAFHATAETKRAEFGMGSRDNLLELGEATTPDVQIEIDVEMAAAAPSN